MKNYFKKFIQITLLLIISLQTFAKTYEIGISQIVEHSVLDSVRAGFEKGLADNNIESNIDFKSAQGDMITQQLIAKGFTNKDLILAISTPTAQSIANAVNNTPILFGAVTSPKDIGILNNPNVTGISDDIIPAPLLKITKEFFPKVKTIGIIYNSSEKNSEINLAEIVRDATPLGIKVEAIGITSLSEVPSALDIVLKKSDAIYMLPDNLVVSAAPLILKNSAKKGTPVFSIGYDQNQIDMGVTIGLSVDYKQLGYNLGVMGAKILKGEPVKNIPYVILDEFPLLINDKTLSKYTTASKEKIENFYKNNQQ